MTAYNFIISNIILNSISIFFLVLAFVMIKKKQKEWHKRFIFTAVFFSLLFLISYVCSHLIGERQPLHLFGLTKIIFYSILISHIPLAMLNVFLVPRTLYLGVCGAFEKHRKLAPWTFLNWIYVSITGVIIFLLQC
jgi:putative membrane protein